MRCSNCGTTMSEPVDSTEPFPCGLPDIVLPAAVSVCPSCGHRHVRFKGAAKAHARIAADLANSERRLAPAEIRFLRKHLGWSGGDFARSGRRSRRRSRRILLVFSGFCSCFRWSLHRMG